MARPFAGEQAQPENPSEAQGERGLGRGALLDGENLHGELMVLDGEPGEAAGLEQAPEDHPRQWVDHLLLDEPLEGAGAVMGVEAAGPAPRGQAQRRPSGRTRQWRVRSRGSKPSPRTQAKRRASGGWARARYWTGSISTES